jgi:hypothetical protein
MLVLVVISFLFILPISNQIGADEKKSLEERVHLLEIKTKDLQILIDQTLKLFKQLKPTTLNKKILPQEKPTPKKKLVSTKQVVTGKLLSKRFVKLDYSKALALKLELKNSSIKDIRALKAELVITDLFGDLVMRISFKFEEVIKAGSVITYNTGIELNQFRDAHMRLKNIEMLNIKSYIEPLMILYVDGTSENFKK